MGKSHKAIWGKKQLAQAKIRRMLIEKSGVDPARFYPKFTQFQTRLSLPELEELQDIIAIATEEKPKPIHNRIPAAFMAGAV